MVFEKPRPGTLLLSLFHLLSDKDAAKQAQDKQSLFFISVYLSLLFLLEFLIHEKILLKRFLKYRTYIMLVPVVIVAIFLDKHVQYCSFATKKRDGRAKKKYNKNNIRNLVSFLLFLELNFSFYCYYKWYCLEAVDSSYSVFWLLIVSRL